MLRILLPALVGLILSAGSAHADEPKTAVNLDELKYAVEMAEKRGANLGAITDAIAAFEKTLKKNAAKPGETPPELVALRETVEAAFKKGENVEAISKELGLIEKAVTGREFERPMQPEPKVEPVPPFRGGRGGRGVVVGGRGVVIGNAGGGFNSTSITISGGEFSVKARQGNVTYVISGTVLGDDAPKITIQDGEKKIETDDIKKVPEDYRANVERLLGSIKR